MSLLLPAALWWLPLVALPVLLHLMQRRHRRHPWAAMALLEGMLARESARVRLESRVLLLLRSLLLLLLVLGLAQPVLEPPPSPDAERRGATAAVLLIDDSLSTRAGRRGSRFEAMRALARAYLDTLSPGDEVSVLRASELGSAIAEAGEPRFDLAVVRRHLAGLEPGSGSEDLPALIEAGRKQLARHLNPGAELVLITDAAAQSWLRHDEQRWRTVLAPLRGSARPGGRERPRVVLLAPPPESFNNVWIEDVRIEAGLIAPGRSVPLRLRLGREGGAGDPALLLRLHLAGEHLTDLPLRLAPGLTDLTHELRFDAAGSYGLRAELVGGRDDLAADDERSLAVSVASTVPVLIVAPHAARLQDDAGTYVAAALQAGDDQLFAVTRRSLADLSEDDLRGQRVLVLCDLPALDGSALAMIERFAVGGGGVLVALGERSDPVQASRHWARGGDGFLPVLLHEQIAHELPQGVDLNGPARGPLAGLHRVGGEVLSGIGLRRHWRMEPLSAPQDQAVVSLSVADGTPLLVLRRCGLGEVAVLALPLEPGWSRLPLLPAFVPLLRGLVGHLAAPQLPERNLRPGEQLVLPVEGEVSVAAWTPSGAALALGPGSWEGRSVMRSGPLQELGLHRLRLLSSAGDASSTTDVHVAVVPDPEQSRLAALDDAALRELLAGTEAVLARDPQQVVDRLGGPRPAPLALAPWLLALALLALIGELALLQRISRQDALRLRGTR